MVWENGNSPIGRFFYFVLNLLSTLAKFFRRRHRVTVNVDIFALYIFSLISRFLNICENMYTSKITFVIAYRANYT